MYDDRHVFQPPADPRGQNSCLKCGRVKEHERHLRFQLLPFSGIDKDIIIKGPDELTIAIDRDDVCAPVVEVQAQRVADILNEHWMDTPPEK